LPELSSGVLEQAGTGCSLVSLPAVRHGNPVVGDDTGSKANWLALETAAPVNVSVISDVSGGSPDSSACLLDAGSSACMPVAARSRRVPDADLAAGAPDG
jgi:hypothetical protein